MGDGEKALQELPRGNRPSPGQTRKIIALKKQKKYP